MYNCNVISVLQHIAYTIPLPDYFYSIDPFCYEANIGANSGEVPMVLVLSLLYVGGWVGVKD